MTVVGNIYVSIFFQLTWEFLGLESERGGSVCWPNNKIIDGSLCTNLQGISRIDCGEMCSLDSEQGIQHSSAPCSFCESVPLI